MSWTDAEEDRIKTIEVVLSDLQIAIANLMSKAQMRQLLLIKQSQIDNLTKRVETLERLIRIIQQHIT